MGLTAHKAYNTAWYRTSSKTPLRCLMREKQERLNIIIVIKYGPQTAFE